MKPRGRGGGALGKECSDLTSEITLQLFFLKNTGSLVHLRVLVQATRRSFADLILASLATLAPWPRISADTNLAGGTYMQIHVPFPSQQFPLHPSHVARRAQSGVAASVVGKREPEPQGPTG